MVHVERAARGSCKDSDEEEKVEVAVNVIFEILNIYSPTSPSNISDVIEIDKLARSKTLNYIKGFN